LKVNKKGVFIVFQTTLTLMLHMTGHLALPVELSDQSFTKRPK